MIIPQCLENKDRENSEVCADDICINPYSIKEDNYSLKRVHNTTVDILFVVDNSGSMFEEQEKLANNIDSFMRDLKRTAADGKTNYHIGVITTSVYDKAQTSDEKIRTKEDGRLLTIQTSSCNDYHLGKRMFKNIIS